MSIDNRNKDFYIPRPLVAVSNPEEEILDNNSQILNETITDSLHVHSQLPSGRSWHQNTLIARIANFFRRIAHFFYSLLPNSSPDVSAKLLASVFGQKGIGSVKFLKTAGTSEVIHFMVNFLKKEALHSDKKADNVLIEKLEKCAILAKELENLAKYGKKDIKKVHDKIKSQLEKLAVGDYLLLPIPEGIDNKEVIYKITKNESNKLQIEIISHDINTLSENVRDKKHEKFKTKVETNLVFDEIKLDKFVNDKRKINDEGETILQDGLSALIGLSIPNYPIVSDIVSTLHKCGGRKIENSKPYYHTANLVGSSFKNILSFIRNEGDAHSSKATKIRMKLRILFSFMNQSHDDLKNNQTLRDLVKEGIRSIISSIDGVLKEEEYNKIYNELKIINDQIVHIENTIDSNNKNISLNANLENFSMTRNDLKEANLHLPNLSKNSIPTFFEAPKVEKNPPKISSIKKTSLLPVKEMLVNAKKIEGGIETEEVMFSSEKNLAKGLQTVQTIKNNAIIYIKNLDYRNAEKEILSLFACFDDIKFRHKFKRSQSLDDPVKVDTIKKLYEELIEISNLLEECVKKEYSISSSKIPLAVLADSYRNLIFISRLISALNKLDNWKGPSSLEFMGWWYNEYGLSNGLIGLPSIKEVKKDVEEISRPNPVDPLIQKILQPVSFINKSINGVGYSKWKINSDARFREVHQIHYNESVLHTYGTNPFIGGKKLATQALFDADEEGSINNFLKKFSKKDLISQEMKEEVKEVIGSLIKARHDELKTLQNKQSGDGDLGLLCRVFDVLKNKPHIIKEVDIRHFILTVLTLEEAFTYNDAFVQEFNLNPFIKLFNKNSSYKDLLPNFVDILKTLSHKYNAISQISAFTFVAKITNMMYLGLEENDKEVIKELIDEQNLTLNNWKKTSLNPYHPLYKHRNALHKQYILSFEGKAVITDDELKELFKAKAVIANSPFLSDDVNPPYDFKVIDILKRQEKNFQRSLKTNEKDYLKFIAELTDLKGSENWKGEYPYYLNEEGYKIDLYTMEAFFPSGEKVGCLPDTILNNKDVIKAVDPALLARAKVELIQNESVNTYKLTGEGVDNVLIEVNNDKISIFRLVEGRHKEKMYVQYVSKEQLFDPQIKFTPNASFFTLIKEVIYFLYNYMNSKDNLPGIFKEGAREFWLNPKKTEEAYIINNQGNLNFITELKPQGFGKITDLRKDIPLEHELAVISNDSPGIFKNLANFCNKNDITLYKKEGKISYIELMGLNLEFAVEDDKIICQNMEFKGWVLNPSHNGILDKQGVEKSLVLTSPDGKQRKLIVPNREVNVTVPSIKLPSGFKLLIKVLKMILFGLPQIQKIKDPSSNKYKLGKFHKPLYYAIELSNFGKISVSNESKSQTLSQLALLSFADAHYENSYRFLQQINKNFEGSNTNKSSLEILNKISSFPVDTPNAIAIRLKAALIVWKQTNKQPNSLLTKLYEEYLANKNSINPNLLIKNEREHYEILAHGVTQDFHIRHPQFAEIIKGDSVITENIIEPSSYKFKYVLDKGLWKKHLKKAANTKKEKSEFKSRYELLTTVGYDKGFLKDEFEEVFEILAALKLNLPDLPSDDKNEISDFINNLEKLLNAEDPEVTKKVFDHLKEQNLTASELASHLQRYVLENKDIPPPKTIAELEAKLNKTAKIELKIEVKKGSEIYTANDLEAYFNAESDKTFAGLKTDQLCLKLLDKLKQDKNPPSTLKANIEAINNGIDAALKVEQAQKKYSFKDDTEKKNLKVKLQNEVANLDTVLNDQQKAIFDILQPNATNLQKLQNLGSRITKVEWNDLVICFLQQDFSSVEHLVPIGSLEDLKEKLTDYFTLANNKQKMLLALQMIEQIEKNVNVEKFSNDVHQLLTTPNPYDPEKNPHILVMEYLSGFAIREDQIEMVNDLINHPNCIRQAMTGAGKTSVILVLSALLKANGQNLVSVMFPKSLFTENLKHLEAKLGKIFDINVYPLEFSMQTPTRTKKGEPSYFEKMYHDLLKVIHSKGSVVTTIETMQALEQKWKGLIDKYSYNATDISEEDRKAITYLAKVIKLCRARQEAMIDEVDRATNPKASNNYRFGNSQTIHPMYGEVLLDIYDILLNQQELGLENNNQGDLKPEVREQSIENAIKEYVKKYPEHCREKLKNYFLGNSEAILEDIKDDKNRDRIVLAKDAFTIFIPLALAKSGNKRYARSENGKDVVLCSFSDTPRENSEPQELIEKMAYTIQDYHAAGVSDKGLKSWYKQKIEEAERGEKELKEVEELFKLWFNKDFSWDENAYTGLISIINQDRKLKRLFLKMQLDSITLSDRTIQNDAFHIASMCKNVAGVTATPPDQLILHDKFEAKGSEKAEVKGKMILNALNKAKGREQNIQFDPTKPQLIITNFNNQDTVVDSSGATRGESIEAMVNQVFAKRKKDIKGICFFDKEGHLLVKTESGVIKKEDCKLKPSELGMVLKEDKARGADVALGEDNRFVIIVDDKQTLSGILQAVGRSRKNEQSIQFATPEDQNLQSFEDVIYSGAKLEAESNAENAFRAQKQKLKNILHNAMMEELLSIDLTDENNISKLIDKFNSFKNTDDKNDLGLKNLFVSENELIENEGDYYKKHKHFHSLKDPIDELNNLRKSLKKFAKDKLETQKDNVLEDLKKVKKSFESIGNHLPEKIKVSGFDLDVDVDVDTDLDVDTDIDTAIDVDLDLEVDQKVEKTKDFRLVPWNRKAWNDGFDFNATAGRDVKLNQLMSSNLNFSTNVALYSEAKLAKYYRSLAQYKKEQLAQNKEQLAQNKEQLAQNKEQLAQNKEQMETIQSQLVQNPQNSDLDLINKMSKEEMENFIQMAMQQYPEIAEKYLSPIKPLKSLNPLDLVMPMEITFNLKYILFRKVNDRLSATLLDIQDYKNAVRGLKKNTEKIYSNGIEIPTLIGNGEDFAIFDLGLNTFIENDNFDVTDVYVKKLIVQSKVYKGQYNDFSEEEVRFIKEWVKESEADLNEMKITFEEAFLSRLNAKGMEEVAKYENSQLKQILNTHL